jgi:hypothetical protein
MIYFQFCGDHNFLFKMAKLQGEICKYQALPPYRVLLHWDHVVMTCVMLCVWIYVRGVTGCV